MNWPRESAYLVLSLRVTAGEFIACRRKIALKSAWIMIAVWLVLCSIYPAVSQSNDETTFGSSSADQFSLKGDIYYLPEGTGSLPDFSTLTPVGTIYTRELNISSRSFDSGFPGITNRFEWFAIRYTGQFRVGTNGKYSFRLLSDDGSRLLIDGRKIIDNDGTHAPQSVSGEVNLDSGIHQIEVDYFQGPRYYVALQLFWTPPGGSEQISQPNIVPSTGTNTGTNTGSTSQAIDLTGVWSCDDAGTYYLRQLGDILWWDGDGPDDAWANVAYGTIDGSTITLDWADVPEGSLRNSGTLVLNIISNDKLIAVETTGGFGGSTWTRRTTGTAVTGPTSTTVTSPTSTPNTGPWNDPSVRSLIDEWLHQQDSCVKAVYGSGAYVDKWGRILGDLTTVTASGNNPPDHPADWDNYHYLWANNWCPDYYPYRVQDYVGLRQQGYSFDDMAECKGENEPCD